ncbi:MAG TPA: ATP-dependent DNA helicase RecQ [Flavobacterium sp.]|jgi:ATP-dependent DNA helicase RecQ
MSEAEAILRKYWNHEQFREPQEEIIKSVCDGNDVFVLLPTGGGKSICFQVPALLKEGLCIVISPLVALMKDQVANLQKKNIKAIALTGGIPPDEVSDLLDNCMFGNYKFLYLSPERMQSDWVLERLKNLPVNLIAIDEAHCVSQWGHDFRPAYLQIFKLKDAFPKVPFVALTASATDRVRNDIVKHLSLRNPRTFEKSFARENIAYMVFNVEDKMFRVEQILKKHQQPSIIYVRNRKSCLDVAAQLNAIGIKATFYHGGLHSKEKHKNMQLWMDDQVQVIVATNAFGMGIDKPDVRTVIHLQLPENLENYYQESGRAGRDGNKAFAVLLTSASDVDTAQKQFISVLPDKDFLIKVFVKLCNHFQIAYGEGIDQQFSFNLNQFCSNYQFPVMKAYNALQFLDRQGIITLSQEFSEKIMAQFVIPSKEVIRYMSLNPADEPVVLAMLRSYPAIHELPVALNLSMLSKKSHTDEAKVHQVLKRLKDMQIIECSAVSNDATVTFNEIREDHRTINRVSKFLENQNKLKIEQLQAVVDYATDNKTCKSKIILRYFGERESGNCGICSNCIKKVRVNSDTLALSDRILIFLAGENLSSREIQIRTQHSADDVIFALRQLLEANVIGILPDNSYTLKRK